MMQKRSEQMMNERHNNTRQQALISQYDKSGTKTQNKKKKKEKKRACSFTDREQSRWSDTNRTDNRRDRSTMQKPAFKQTQKQRASQNKKSPPELVR